MILRLLTRPLSHSTLKNASKLLSDAPFTKEFKKEHTIYSSIGCAVIFSFFSLGSKRKGEILWRAFHGERFFGIRRADSKKDSNYKTTSYESILSKPSSISHTSKHSFVITITILLQKKEQAWRQGDEGGRDRGIKHIKLT